ncbi:MAG: phasin family protein [Acetobacteraceae bacterium]|nr:phasin family protein [Acetobacteraceae bacterium]
MNKGVFPDVPAGAHSVTELAVNASSLLEQSRAVSEHFSMFGQDAADFIQKRLAHNINTFNALAKCRSLPELLQVQTHWLTEAFSDYAAQMLRGTQLGNLAPGARADRGRAERADA